MFKKAHYHLPVAQANTFVKAINLMPNKKAFANHAVVDSEIYKQIFTA